MRVLSLTLLAISLTIFCPANYSWGRGVALPAGVLKQVAAVLTTGMLNGRTAVSRGRSSLEESAKQVAAPSRLDVLPARQCRRQWLASHAH